MKFLFALATLIALYIAFSVGRIYYYANFSKNPSIQQKDEVFGSEQEPKNPELRYIAAGDSTAAGEGASSVEKTYTYKIAQELAKERTVQYKNIAVRGAQTKDVLETQLAQIIEFAPNIVTISIGANDATHLVSEKNILKNYQAIIASLLENTEAQIYITNIANFDGARLLPIPFVQLIEHRSAKINPKIQALETERVKIINIHDFGWSNYPDKQVTYSLDFFHPSDIGYENWTNAFLDKYDSK